jgi:quinol monooxygenase YgiN
MKFKQEKIADFLAVFQAAKPKIEAFPGCQKVDLVNDINDPCILMTISVWNNPDALEDYRNSTLFKTTWAATKIHFSEKAEAWSVDIIA